MEDIMKSLLSYFALCALAFGVHLTQGRQCHAGLLPTSSSVTQNGSNYVYSYGLSLTSNATLQAGDSFTIYDFAGLVPNSNTQPTGFTFSSALVGPTPAGTTPVDSPTISNVTWTFTGSGAPIGPASVGNFAVQSQFSMTTTGSFTSTAQMLAGDRAVDVVSQAQVTTPSANCDPVVNSAGGPVVDVAGGPVVGLNVPEPASLVMCAGLPLLVFFWKRCKQSSERSATVNP
jgi:hypothetical protein